MIDLVYGKFLYIILLKMVSKYYTNLRHSSKDHPSLDSRNFLSGRGGGAGLYLLVERLNIRIRLQGLLQFDDNEFTAVASYPIQVNSQGFLITS